MWKKGEVNPSIEIEEKNEFNNEHLDVLTQ
jgi:hypothetical protein